MPASEVPPGSTRSVDPVVVVALADDLREGGRRLRNLARERRAIQGKLEGRASVEILPDVLLEEVWTAFEREEHQGRIQVFHFAGHASSSWLAVADESGAPVRAHAGGLAGFLGRQAGLVLVFLNGCSTREQVRRLREGVPAVIATTDAILDEVAAAFAERFYAGLAAAKPLRRAFLDAEDFVKSRHGDGPSDVTRDAAVVPAPGTSEWPWILDCDQDVESWCLGDGLDRPEPAPPEPRRSLRWSALGLAAIVLGAGTWIGVQLWSKPEPKPKPEAGSKPEPEAGSKPEPEPEPEPPFEMTLVPQRVVRYCSSSTGCSHVEVPAFCVAITEMVQSRWADYGGPPSEDHGDELPVNAITWGEAVQMANRLSRRESLEPCYRQAPEGWDFMPACDGYHLPTDHEWSVLADAHGEPTCDNANVADYDYLDQRPELAESYRPRFGDIAPFDCGSDSQQGDGHGSLAPVGSMPRSGPFGVQDLQGNVAEWVWDAERDLAIVRGHSFAWPGRNDGMLDDPSPATPPVERDEAVGVRYVRRPIAPDEPDAAPRCSRRVDEAK